MSELTTPKPINLRQLADALGTTALTTRPGPVVGETVVTAHDATTQTALRAAVDNHNAIDEAGNKATLEQQALTAMQNNRDDVVVNDAYLAVANPTNAQVAAQVRALTVQSTRQARELNGIARLILGKLDATT